MEHLWHIHAGLSFLRYLSHMTLDPRSSLRVESLGVESLGPRISELTKDSLVWGSRVWGSRVWRSRVWWCRVWGPRTWRSGVCPLRHVNWKERLCAQIMEWNKTCYKPNNGSIMQEPMMGHLNLLGSSVPSFLGCEGCRTHDGTPI